MTDQPFGTTPPSTGPGSGEEPGRAPERTRDPVEAARVNDLAARKFAATYSERSTKPVVVIIPAYNEVESVAEVVRNVPAQLCGLDVDTLVVDDGSADSTGSEAAKAGALVATLSKNTGQGNAFKLGYRVSVERGVKFITTADADGQFDPHELEGLLERIVNGNADLVTGSRRLGAAHTKDNVRSLGVVVFGTMISVLTGTKITDPANGLRAMRAEVASTVELRQLQYQSSELLIRTVANGFKVEESPVTMYERAGGDSKKGGNLSYGYRFSKVVIGTWWTSRATARKSLNKRQGLWF